MQVVAGAGAIDHTQLVDLAGKSFANLPTNPTTADDLVKKVTAPHDQIYMWQSMQFQVDQAWMRDQ